MVERAQHPLAGVGMEIPRRAISFKGNGQDSHGSNCFSVYPFKSTRISEPEAGLDFRRGLMPPPTLIMKAIEMLSLHLSGRGVSPLGSS